MVDREKIIPAKKGEGGICIGPHAPSFKEIVLVPYKIDQHGTIHIRAMVKSTCKGYKVKIKRLVAMGVFNKEILEIKKCDKGI